MFAGWNAVVVFSDPTRDEFCVRLTASTLRFQADMGATVEKLWPKRDAAAGAFRRRGGIKSRPGRGKRYRLGNGCRDSSIA